MKEEKDKVTPPQSIFLLIETVFFVKGI